MRYSRNSKLEFLDFCQVQLISPDAISDPLSVQKSNPKSISWTTLKLRFFSSVIMHKNFTGQALSLVQATQIYVIDII